MRRSVYTYARPDGGTDVVTIGPLSRGWRAARVIWALVFIVTALVAACESQWSTSAFALLVGAIILPNMRRRRRP
jgi:hypothetical protein